MRVDLHNHTILCNHATGTVDEYVERAIELGIDRLSMIMTNSNSIQDVLFFPQMRPEVVNTSLDLEMEELDGVPAPWDDVLRKMGIQNKEQLKAVNPNKLFNDLGGMRKKLKLEVAMPSLDDVRQWIG